MERKRRGREGEGLRFRQIRYKLTTFLAGLVTTSRFGSGSCMRKTITYNLIAVNRKEQRGMEKKKRE